MRAIRGLGQEIGQGWKAVAEGWGHLREKASRALTRFSPAGSPHRFDSELRFVPEAGPAWGLLAGEVLEDSERIVVRVEVPGMEARDLNVRVEGQRLRVSGDKQSSRQSESGQYRVYECAYGQFERAFELPAPVTVEKAQASYRQGVLRVELPKARRSDPRSIEVKVR